MTVVRAAGGIPVRDGRDGLEVLVVHREVQEETGLVCALERELPSTAYHDSRARQKRVRYWRLRVHGGQLSYVHEVDEARWLSPAEAETLLSYARDVDVLRVVSA